MPCHTDGLNAQVPFGELQVHSCANCGTAIGILHSSGDHGAAIQSEVDCRYSLTAMPQSTAVLLMEQYEAVLTDTEALALHIAQENWDTPEKLRVISDVRVLRNGSRISL